MGCNGTSNDKCNTMLNIGTCNIIWIFWTEYFMFLLLSLLPVGVGIFGSEDTEIKLFFENWKHSQNKVVTASLHAFYNALMHFLAIAQISYILLKRSTNSVLFLCVKIHKIFLNLAREQQCPHYIELCWYYHGKHKLKITGLFGSLYLACQCYLSFWKVVCALNRILGNTGTEYSCLNQEENEVDDNKYLKYLW